MKHSSCDFPLLSRAECADLIISRVKHAQPFSLVRLGDGEGALLSIHKDSPEIDRAYFSMHFGPSGTDLELLINLRNLLTESICSSDLVGVRDDIVNVDFDSSLVELTPESFMSAFKNNFRLRDVEKDLGYEAARRIALLHTALENMDMPEQIEYCSAWSHYDLHLTGAIFRCLLSQRKIGMITSRYELCPVLEDMFDLSVACWNIPDMYLSIGEASAPSNYIQKLEAVMQQQLVEFPGMVFLVGGGLYGKLYCGLIKSQGGVALDLGSLLDAWAGIHSRPAVYSTILGDEYDDQTVPEKLSLNDRAVRRGLSPVERIRKVFRVNRRKKSRREKFGRDLERHFDKIWCINLDSRPDRWRYMQNHFARFGLGDKVERFSAVDVRSDPGLQRHQKLLKNNFSLLAMCGCMLSHRQIVESARAAGLRNVLVFEDDIKILSDNIASIGESLDELSAWEWDVFYLGATYHWGLEAVSKNLVRVSHGALATHAIAYNAKVFDKVLELLPASSDEFLNSQQFSVNALDMWLQSDLFDHSRFYASNPIMVVQTLQESDIAFNQMGGIERAQIELFYKNLEA